MSAALATGDTGFKHQSTRLETPYQVAVGLQQLGQRTSTSRSSRGSVMPDQLGLELLALRASSAFALTPVVKAAATDCQYTATFIDVVLLAQLFD